MGCHTWFYRKENRTIEQARDMFIESCKEVINTFNEVLENKDGKYDSFKERGDFSVDSLSHDINKLQRHIRMVEKGLCNVAVMNHQPESCKYIQDKGLFITDDSLPHDVFRIGGYPENKLFSMQDTLDFMESNKYKINMDNKIECLERLKLFWKQNPDGMINFG